MMESAAKSRAAFPLRAALQQFPAIGHSLGFFLVPGVRKDADGLASLQGHFFTLLSLQTDPRNFRQLFLRLKRRPQRRDRLCHGVPEIASHRAGPERYQGQE